MVAKMQPNLGLSCPLKKPVVFEGMRLALVYLVGHRVFIMHTGKHSLLNSSDEKTQVKT
jgi:hypothetical protein